MAYTNEMRICPDDRLSLLHSASSGSSRLNLFQSPLTGSSLFPFDVKSEGVHRLVRWLEEEQITICHLTPALFRQLAGLLPGPDSLPHLRLIHLSGEPVSRRDLELYRENFSPRTVLRIYMGTTETVEVCSYIVDPAFSFPESGVPLGYAAPGKRVRLLDENGGEVGPDQVGEIAVQSRYLSLGYWKKPALTRQKFLPDPDGGEERIYPTGDLGRMLPDGFLVHLGRKDFQLKVRGYRVETGEVEMALLAHENIKEAVVLGRPDRSGGVRLVAYFVPAGRPATTVSELRLFLNKKLPDYMVPSTFVALNALPLTPSGKVDRSALPPAESSRPELDTPYVAPRTPLEKQLAEIWADVLGLDRIGVNDDFFHLGGQSLLASQIISRITQKFRIELPLQLLFQAPTVAEMAAVISQHETKKAAGPELARMLDELESLSDADAQKRLKTETPS
jgi:acyl carrier protein